jgi:CubicO group peptidase (beta-lactamase class C family)
MRRGIIDATGQEVTFAYVNAVLRDWARLGLMLANRGNWQGKTVVPEDRLTASAADALPTDSPLAKYGYQIWVFRRHQTFCAARPSRTICLCRSGPEACSRADRA